MTLQIVIPGEFTAPGLPDLGVRGFSDTFTRPNATTLGNTEKPKRPWSLWPQGETVEGGVTGGNGYVRSTTTNARRFAFADAKISDGSIEATIAGIDTAFSSNQVGVAARASSERYAWLFYAHSTTEFRLSSLINNTMTDVQVVTAVTPKAGDVLRLTVDGDQITGYVNGVARASTTSSQLQTNTLFGVYANSTTTANLVDNVQVTPTA